MCSWYLRPFFCFYFVSFYLNYFFSLSESLRRKKSCISCNQWQRYRYFTEWCIRVSFSIQSCCMSVTNRGRYLIPLWSPICLTDLLPLCPLGSSFCSSVPWQLLTAAISRKLFTSMSPHLRPLWLLQMLTLPSPFNTDLFCCTWSLLNWIWPFIILDSGWRWCSVGEVVVTQAWGPEFDTSIQFLEG